MEEMISRRKSVRIGRAALSFLVLSAFLLIPTIRLKSRFALAIARLPVWRRYEFFRVMFDIIEQERPPRRAV
jgi:hypothetical protein